MDPTDLIGSFEYVKADLKGAVEVRSFNAPFITLWQLSSRVFVLVMNLLGVLQIPLKAWSSQRRQKDSITQQVALSVSFGICVSFQREAPNSLPLSEAYR